jgi:thiosulfate/3-mercaptopyruvate sulfurtransferase
MDKGNTEPSGLFREIREGGFRLEYFSADGRWVQDNGLGSYLFEGEPGVKEVSEGEAHDLLVRRGFDLNKQLTAWMSTGTHDIPTEVLVDTDWLDAHVDDPGVVVIEADENQDLFHKGHIRNAISLDWEAELRALPRRELISASSLRELLERKGVSGTDLIVLYSDGGNAFASYAYWVLKLRGIGNLRLLDGGRRKWELESRVLSQDVVERPAGSIPLTAESENIRISRNEVLTRVGHKSTVFLDVRSRPEYDGELWAPVRFMQESAQVSGHIPNAINIPLSQLVTEDGTFRSRQEIHDLVRSFIPSRLTEVITYSSIGERSALMWFVLSELLGFPNVRNYDGGWTEYGSLVGAPVHRR